VTGFDRDLFASFAPDERALLAWVAPQLDATMIEEIAAGLHCSPDAPATPAPPDGYGQPS